MNVVTRALVLLGMALLAAIPFIPVADRLASFATHGWLFGLMVLVFAIACILGDAVAMHAALVPVLYLGAYVLPIVGSAWPLPLIVILIAYGGVFAGVPSARRWFGDWSRARFDRTTMVIVLAQTAVAAVALLAWRYGSGVNMETYRSAVPDGIPIWLIFVGLVPYAMLNAVFEEVLWRGILWQSCEDAFGPRAALGFTALSFGLAHYRGFPSGWLGVGLAFVYGLMLGVVRLRSGGLWACWCGHVVTDIVIYTMVAAMFL